MHICTHTCTHTHTRTCYHQHIGEQRGRCIQPCTSAHTHTHSRTWTYTCAHTHTHVYTLAHIFSPTHRGTKKQTNPDTHICTYKYVHEPTLVHLHLHTHVRTRVCSLPGGCPTAALPCWTGHHDMKLQGVRQPPGGPAHHLNAGLFRSSESRVASSAGLWDRLSFTPGYSCFP